MKMSVDRSKPELSSCSKHSESKSSMSALVLMLVKREAQNAISTVDVE